MRAVMHLMLMLSLMTIGAACIPLSATTNGIQNAAVARSRDEVVVGLAAALRGEGVAPLGIDIERGARLAIADQPTIEIDGRSLPVRLEVLDDACAPNVGQAVASRFVADEHVVAVVGPMCSSGCRAAAPIFDAAGFTTISPSCTNADLTTSGFRSFNRTVVSDAVQGMRAAEYIYSTLGLTRIATLHDGSPYAEGLVRVVAGHFESLGGQVVARDAISAGDVDFRALLEDISQDAPELIYFAGFAPEGARLAEQRTDAGLDDVMFMGGDGLRTQDFIELAGSAAENVYVSVSVPSTSALLTDLIGRYVLAFGEEPPGPYHANAYDAVRIILSAVEAVGGIDENGYLIVERAQLGAYVRTLRDYEGLSGLLGANGSGEFIESAQIEIACVRGGTFASVAFDETCPPRNEQP